MRYHNILSYINSVIEGMKWKVMKISMADTAIETDMHTANN